MGRLSLLAANGPQGSQANKRYYSRDIRTPLEEFGQRPSPRPGRLLVKGIDNKHRLVYKVEKDAVLIEVNITIESPAIQGTA